MPKVPPYSDEFKREAVKLLRTGDRAVPQLAKELGVSEGSLRNWSTQLDVEEGKTRREAMRTLKRFLARRVYNTLTPNTQTN